MKVYYKKEDPGTEGYKKYGNHIMYPTRIEPERVNPNDYVCEGTGEQIVVVKHKVSNMSIKFIAYEDIVKKDKKPAQITLYYSIDSKTKSINDIENLNTKIRANLEKEKAEMDAEGYRKQYDELTEAIEKIRQSKNSRQDRQG